MTQETKARTILIADDEPDILEIINYNLLTEGYNVFTAKNGNEAVELAKLQKPDMIILDVMMPGKTGFEVCKILRTLPEFENTIILFLTALNDDSTQIKGLETGGDDYITKPISPKVLLSRVNAHFRRSIKETGSILQIGDLSIDREKYIVTSKDEEIVLARKEFELLALLASKPSKVFLRNEILHKVWGTDVIVGDRTIDVHIRKIRQKLGDECITTVKGVGYKFQM
ncbi:MAG: response regulator transcription factor [Bacteroidota bacterium]|nr:response regulator transcription factor [Bacteroidota bacterium]